MQLSGKTILITGGSRGIGRATALLAAQQGAKVAVNYVSHQSEAAQTVEEIKAAGGEAIMVQADVAKYDEVETMINQVQQTFGSLDILVNNCGILSMKPLAEESIEKLDQMIAVNLGGPMHTIKAALPVMLQQQSPATIINVASQAAVDIFPGAFLATYSATKAGVVRLTEVLAHELAASQIKLFAVLPGGTATDMTGQQGMPAEKVGQRIIDAITEQLGLVSGAATEIFE